MKIIQKYSVDVGFESGDGTAAFELDVPYIGEILRVSCPRYDHINIWIRVVKGGPAEIRSFRLVKREDVEAEGFHVASFPIPATKLMRELLECPIHWHLFEVIRDETRWTEERA